MRLPLTAYRLQLWHRRAVHRRHVRKMADWVKANQGVNPWSDREARRLGMISARQRTDIASLGYFIQELS